MPLQTDGGSPALCFAPAALDPAFPFLPPAGQPGFLLQLLPEREGRRGLDLLESALAILLSHSQSGLLFLSVSVVVHPWTEAI